MLRTVMVAALASTASLAQAQDAVFELDAETREIAQSLGQTALASDLAYEITESLTTEVGPRLAGTPQEARAREWAVETLERLDFENVRVEPFELDLWTRGRSVYEEVAITAPYPQPLYAISLGGAGATPEGGLEAEVVFFDSYDSLLASDASADALEGKLVFVNDRMVASRTGEGYGWANRKRRDAWVMAEDRGASGLLIRSVGTSTNRFAHTGMMSFPEGRHPEIPALAVSGPDADQIQRLHEMGETIRINMRTYAGWRGQAMSGNVIAEIEGSEAPDEIVIIGAHLDSWDTATGALDDGAGVGIVTAAAKLIADSGHRPRRTIRVVLFGAEEVGLVGARAYANARMEDGTIPNHIIGSESDFGAREVWRMGSNVGEHALPEIAAIHRELQSLGVVPGDNEGGGGPDMIPLQYMGVPMVRLEQNGEDYFEFHHTPNDTFDKIVPEEMAQNVAAWTMMVWLLADSETDFRPQAQQNAASE
ncbi:M20/M25/M40 family metallo-hydrolase [Oceanicaulis sp. LC35]|uniref:M20/M25/M40 family metallo-hydrolase n=1 Tax=Oceanicaulis sp. LC35 TaxID=3349635 RepID=UPI003F873027